MEKQTINILIVDDRKENLLALEAVLSSPHYRLVKALSGEEALKWLLKEEFAVILMDVQMPGLNGFETAKIIRVREKTKEIPIIFITALSQTIENVLHGYSVGAIDFIIKPFDPVILKSKVDGFVSMFLHKKQVENQTKIIANRTKELEKAYRALKKSEEMSRAVGETSVDTIFSINAVGCILTVNPSVTPMLGYSPNELIGKEITTLIPHLTSEYISKTPKQVIIEMEARKKNCELLPVDVQLAEIEIDFEKIYVCSIRDITDRKTHFELLERLVKERTNELILMNKKLKHEFDEKQITLKKLQESEEKYRQLVENSPEAIIVIKVHSNKLSFINQTGVQLLKAQTKNEIINRQINEFIHPEDLEKIEKFLNRFENIATYDPFECKLICLNGEIIFTEVKIILFQYQGESSYHIMVRDITELKKSREFIQQSEKLNVVGELAAGIAHEIRNPLTSLKGFTQLLCNKMDSNHDYMEIMITEIERINTIVSELLMLVKPKKLEFKEIDLGKVLKNIITLMNAQANLYGVKIKLNSFNDLDHYIIYGIENSLKQVFINLLKNSIEAMHNGGDITIDVERKDKIIEINFSDKGCGIPQEILSKLGQPFFTTKEKGTGLGLMVCYSIIENHQGTMLIDSVNGEGTTVSIRLPLFQKQHKTVNI